MEDGPFLLTDHNATKWAWPTSRDPISKLFWDPITFERIKLSTSKKFGTQMEDGPSVRMDHI